MNRSSTKPIPNCLRKCRKELGLTQVEVAKTLHLQSTAIISRWEQGVCLPSIPNAVRLAVLYRTMMDAFFLDLRWAAKKELAGRH
jgi:DNA-binding XRE family transcriptional regulator